MMVDKRNMGPVKRINIAIFASGSGTNAENIICYMKSRPDVSVRMVLCNNKDAGVFERAERLGVPAVLFNRADFSDSQIVLKILKDAEIDFIVLAGFLWLIPYFIIREYEGKIVNIHPALLPKFGGKGMYGMNVHKAVKDSGETETGITIHWVNEHYDEGDVIFQAKCPVDPSDSPDAIATRVHKLEYEYFPKVIDGLIKELL